MPDHSYIVEKYESLLKNELTKLIVIAAILSLIFIAIILYSIIQIKNDKTKKVTYVQLVGSILLFGILAISLGSQLFFFRKDVVNEAYIQYEGTANIRTERQIIFGGIPTGYNEHIISFEHNGKQVELSMRKDCGITGNVDNVYIVYSKHSEFILDIKIIE